MAVQRRASLILIFTFIFLLFHAGGLTKEGDEYLYVKSDIIDPSFPITEYKTTKLPVDNKNVTAERPDFLFDSNYRYHRVVEFYAPWCPHCVHFREKFIGFARNITEMCKPVNVTIQVIAVSCMAHLDMCRELRISSYPRIRLIPAGSINSTELDYWELHPFHIFRHFGIAMEEFKLPSQVGALKPKMGLRKKDGDNAAATGAPTRHVRTQEELYSDIYASFDFAMRNSVFMENGPLSVEQKRVLREWLELLQKTLPPFWKMQSAITAILGNFEKVSESEAGLLRIISQYPPPSRKWTPACFEGYTCGLWEMFHVMAVGVVEYNKVAIPGEYLSVTEAADTLRDYIKYFFACEVCRRHFIHEYEQCSHDRCNRLKSEAKTIKDWMEFPLWLFEEHNAVNVRLKHEAAERKKEQVTAEDELTVKWPSRQECPKCWLDEQRWDEEMVYRFLRLNYWIHDAESISVQRELLVSKPKAPMVDGGDAHHSYHVPKLLYFSCAAVVVLIGLVWYVEDVRLRKSGYHKKNEG